MYSFIEFCFVIFYFHFIYRSNFGNTLCVIDLSAFVPPLTSSCSRLDNNSNNYQDMIESSTPKSSFSDDIISMYSSLLLF